MTHRLSSTLGRIPAFNESNAPDPVYRSLTGGLKRQLSERSREVNTPPAKLPSGGERSDQEVDGQPPSINCTLRDAAQQREARQEVAAREGRYEAFASIRSVQAAGSLEPTSASRVQAQRFRSALRDAHAERMAEQRPRQERIPAAAESKRPQLTHRAGSSGSCNNVWRRTSSGGWEQGLGAASSSSAAGASGAANQPTGVLRGGVSGGSGDGGHGGSSRGGHGPGRRLGGGGIGGGRGGGPGDGGDGGEVHMYMCVICHEEAVGPVHPELGDGRACGQYYSRTVSRQAATHWYCRACLLDQVHTNGPICVVCKAAFSQMREPDGTARLVPEPLRGARCCVCKGGQSTRINPLLICECQHCSAFTGEREVFAKAVHLACTAGPDGRGRWNREPRRFFWASAMGEVETHAPEDFDRRQGDRVFVQQEDEPEPEPEPELQPAPAPDSEPPPTEEDMEHEDYEQEMQELQDAGRRHVEERRRSAPHVLQTHLFTHEVDAVRRQRHVPVRPSPYSRPQPGGRGGGGGASQMSELFGPEVGASAPATEPATTRPAQRGEEQLAMKPTASYTLSKHII